MLVNLSNHPSGLWTIKQMKLAREQYNIVLDLPFPLVDPDLDAAEICKLAKILVERCCEMLPSLENNAVHIMGEMTLTFAVVYQLKKKGINCVASTTERIAHMNENTKTAEFFFVRFREYIVC